MNTNQTPTVAQFPVEVPLGPGREMVFDSLELLSCDGIGRRMRAAVKGKIGDFIVSPHVTNDEKLNLGRWLEDDSIEFTVRGAVYIESASNLKWLLHCRLYGPHWVSQINVGWDIQIRYDFDRLHGRLQVVNKDFRCAN